MIEAVTLLMKEHQLILRAMRVAQIMSKAFYDQKQICTEDLENWIEFVQKYADAFHHEKEEDVLFVWMRERGFPENGGGPIACMLREHDVGRNLIQSIRIAQPQAMQGDLKNLETVCAALIDFAGHLSSHIYKEDNILYPMANQMARPEDNEEIFRRYQNKIPADRARTEQLKAIAMVDQLEAKYHDA